MKSKILLFSCLLLASLLMVSCNKDDNQWTSEDLTENKVAPLPDLIISAYGSNIPTKTTICGPSLPNVSCAGGNRSFIATVAVANRGQGDLAPGGTITIRWVDLSNPSQFQDQIVPNPGIPAGNSIRVSRPYWMGPCGCVPPFTSFTHSFMAAVDPLNLIQESAQDNNRSPQFDTCDGC